MKRLFFVFLLAAPAFGQLLTSTPNGIAVAHNSRLSISGKWTTEGVENPTFITSNDQQIAVLDALNNEAVIADLTTGKSTRMRTAETPIAAAFLNGELYVLARDARVLQHGTTQIPLSVDPSFLREGNGRLYVYGRAEGVIEEIQNDQVTRRVSIAPHASDFEIAGTTAYLVY
ncbi:MAG: hypothetical protein ACLGH0_12205, partial [Thermoanaerobaculia bacterium]